MLSQVYSATIPIAGTSTSAIQLNETYDQLWMSRDAMASMATIYVQGSADGVTYKRILDPTPNVNPVASAVTSTYHYATSVSGYFAPVPVGFNYIKFETASAPAAAISFTVIATKFGR